MKNIFVLLTLFFFSHSLFAQMWNGQDTLYGNEWINYDQTYFKIKVAEDGIYKIPFDVLQNKVPSNVEAKQLQLFYLGQEIPIYTSTTGTLSSNDFIEFYGKKNRGKLDRFLYENPDEDMMNPYYSLFTDTSAYFLTWVENDQNERMEEFGNNLSGWTQPEPFFMHEIENVYGSTNIKKTQNVGSANVSFSSFDTGQGFSSPFENANSFNLSVLHPFNQSQSDAILNLRILGRGTGDSQDSIVLNGNEIIRNDYSGHELKDENYTIPLSSFTENNIIEVFGLNDGNNNQIRTTISRLSLTYPSLFDFENKTSFKFKIEASNGVKYLEIQNFNSGNTPILYDITNNYRLEATLESGVVKIALPLSLNERELILVNSEMSFDVEEMEEIDFVNYWEQEGDFVILTHPALFDDGNGNNWVQNYADYRRTSIGGNYNPIIVNVEQLYDQFSYGIIRHSISVRNYAHFIKKHWSNPSYFFIIGKGMQYLNVRNESQIADHYLKTFFVPTFGDPGADNLLIATPGTRAPIFAIGRLAARSGNDVKIYYDKVTSFEANKYSPQTLSDKGWMKNVVHLGGGGVGDQLSIKAYLEGYKNKIENNDFAAQVISFFKTSSDPIQGSQSQALFRAINQGSSIITFFGHSSANGFDFQVDSPESYGNKDRYPLMFSFGCHSGRCHDDVASIGEKFVLANESGAIGYVASTGFGFINSLGVFGNTFYDEVGGDMYGEGIGDILKVATEALSGSLGDKLLAEQSTLQGDPSIRLNAHEGPDFVVDISTVLKEPDLINLQSEEVLLNFDIHNIGIGNQDTFELNIDQELPSGDIVNLLTDRVTVPGFQENFSYKLPTIQQSEVIGQNYYHIRLDTESEVDEKPNPDAELNNSLVNSGGREGLPILITSNDLVPVYPSRFAIVNNPDLKLITSTADAFAIQQTYYLEIDTTEYFNSPFKKRLEKEGSGGVLKWEPNITYENEQVYYWRVSPDSIDASIGYRWYNSSFIFLEDELEGWNQSHFFQYKKGALHNELLDEPDRKFKYVKDFKDLTIYNRKWVAPGYGDDRPSLILNNDDIFFWRPKIAAGVYVAVFDSLTVDPWYDIDGESPYGDDAYGQGTFPFWTHAPKHREDLIHFLEDTIPSGNYILFMAFFKEGKSYEAEEWAMDSVNFGINLFQILEKQGAQIVRDLEDGSVPYIFFYRKDRSDYQPIERITDEDGIILEGPILIPGFWDSGEFTSTHVGPAANWNTLQWEMSDYDDYEDAYIQISGVNPSIGLDIVLKDGIREPEIDLSDINSNIYPYLKLKLFTSDTTDRKPPQLEHWRVLFDELPEAALNPMAFFEMDKDTLQRGDVLNIGIAIENIGKYDMDSLLMNYKIVNAQNGELIIEDRLNPLLIQDTIMANLQVDTRDLSGYHTLIIDANPNGDQPELTHQNNIGIVNFYVKNDKRNPLLDVTFDGIHIMEGDIVSPKTEIKITLEDENKYLALNDTSLFQVWLQYPEAIDAVLIPFDSEFMQFFPANSNDLEKENKARIEFKPDLFEDGIYKLMVKGQDVAGNASGNIDYSVSFEVISKAMISNILNYPNPFSTSTQFVYTLTGTEIPAYYKIQIMTVSGRIVREIQQDELGELRIGTHRTEFAWDGTDQYGDRLANGVYLYRFVAKNADGSDYEHYQRDNVDKLFQKGFGKMVLIK